MKLLLKNLLFIAIVPGSAAGWVPWLFVRGRSIAGGAGFAVGLALMAVGVALFAWCVWDFAMRGRGTPAPIDAPKTLVVTGPYRYSRNPMYVAVLTVLAGWYVLYRSPWLIPYALFLATSFVLFVRLYEEPHLAREFGDEYAEYCERVGRWLPRSRGR